jgi:choline dehydrogenase-like flavoprotein
MYNITGLFEHEDVAPKRYSSTGIVSDQFYEGDPSRRGFVRGFWYLSSGYTGPVRAALGEPPQPRATVIPAALKMERDGPLPWGRVHHAAFQQQYSHTVGTSILFEEIPQDTNYVELDSSITDDVGIPGIKLHFKRSQNLEKMIAFALDRTKDVMMAAGATKILSAQPLAEGGAYHLMGTARMGNDPSKSVVDKWGRSHEVKNLFIIDGSIFVSAGSAVVTSTLQSLALRIADYVKKNSKDLLKNS